MRMIHILSICFKSGTFDEDSLFSFAEQNLQEQTDIVLFPESCMGDQLHTVDHPFLKHAGQFAAAHNTYLLCPVFLVKENKRYNAAVLFDRTGNSIYTYDKVYPFHAELKKVPPVVAGSKVNAVETDFGRIAIATCFDANFPSLWREIAYTNPDIVFWVSAYSGGMQLTAHALNHHYPIVTSTKYPDCAVYDPDGREVFYSYREGKPLAAQLHMDIDRVICHYNFNKDRVERLIAEHPQVEIEREHDREQWILLHTRSQTCSVRTLCKEYGITPLRSYKQESESLIDGLRQDKAKEEIT